jgi:hypothetical protein
MNVLIEMPLAIYQGFMGRCLLDSREYEILKNSVISHVPEYLRDGNVVECLCTVEDAKLLLAHAKRFYPVAGSHVEEAIRLAREASPVTSHIAYRKAAAGDTWHHCSDCSHWPSEDFLSSNNLPDSAQLCNECVVKSQHDERE